LINEDKNELSKSKTKNFFSWLSFIIGVIVVLVLIGLVSIILSFFIRHKKQRHFKSVPVYV